MVLQQGCSERAHVGPTVSRILFDRSQDSGNDLTGRTYSARCGLRWLVGEHADHDRRCGSATEWRSPGEQLVQRDPEQEDIGPDIRRAAGQLLGTQVMLELQNVGDHFRCCTGSHESLINSHTGYPCTASGWKKYQV